MCGYLCVIFFFFGAGSVLLVAGVSRGLCDVYSVQVGAGAGFGGMD